MLVVPLSQVVLTAVIAPRQHIVNGVKGLFLTAVLNRTRFELDNGMLR
jgi:hypothetical protein